MGFGLPALSIRWRLTLWYGLVLAVALAAFAAAVYFTQRHHALQRVEKERQVELFAPMRANELPPLNLLDDPPLLAPCGGISGREAVSLQRAAEGRARHSCD